jgi:hypothetical protein
LAPCPPKPRLKRTSKPVVTAAAVRVLATTDEPEQSAGVHVDVAPVTPRSIIIRWPESMHSAELRTSVKHAALEALVKELLGYEVDIC